MSILGKTGLIKLVTDLPGNIALVGSLEGILAKLVTESSFKGNP